MKILCFSIYHCVETLQGLPFELPIFDEYQVEKKVTEWSMHYFGQFTTVLWVFAYMIICGLTISSITYSVKQIF